MRVKERSEFGERLFQARTYAKLSQAELAARVPMSQSNLAGLEKKGQGSAKAVRIAEVTGVSAAWLAHNQGPMLPTATAVLRAEQVVAPYMTAPSANKDFRTLAFTMAAALESTGTQLSVQQLLALVDAAHKRLND